MIQLIYMMDIILNTQYNLDSLIFRVVKIMSII